MTVPQYRRLRRVEASAYLKEKWGIERKASTLAKLAVIGGGPRFESANRVPLYPEPELDRWATSIISPVKRSTADTGAEHLELAEPMGPESAALIRPPSRHSGSSSTRQCTGSTAISSQHHDAETLSRSGK
jgi:hypothetical protein